MCFNNGNDSRRKPSIFLLTTYLYVLLYAELIEKSKFPFFVLRAQLGHAISIHREEYHSRRPAVVIHNRCIRIFKVHCSGENTLASFSAVLLDAVGNGVHGPE